MEPGRAGGELSIAGRYPARFVFLFRAQLLCRPARRSSDRRSNGIRQDVYVGDSAGQSLRYAVSPREKSAVWIEAVAEFRGAAGLMAAAQSLEFRLQSGLLPGSYVHLQPDASRRQSPRWSNAPAEA